VEEAFFQFEIEIVKLGNFEDVVDSTVMVIKVSVSGDADVVHIYADCGAEGFVFEDDVLVDEVHHGLEGCWRISESKIHDCWFEESVSGFKRRFLFIPFADLYVIVAPPDVEFSVYVCIAKISNEVRDQRKGVLVPDGDGINFAIVLYQSHFAILFTDEEEGRCVW